MCTKALEENSLFEMITAATWKNQVNRCTDLDEIYKLVPNLTPHSIDSCFIGIYGILKYHKLEWKDVPYKDIIGQLQSFVL